MRCGARRFRIYCGDGLMGTAWKGFRNDIEPAYREAVNSRLLEQVRSSGD